jgi:PTS system cellobiose-specific IIB component
MNTILIVCGAGASSTFVASRIRSVAASRSLPVVVEAGSIDDLADRLGGADVLLLGAHLADRFDALAAEAEVQNVRCALLPSTVLAAGGPEAALDLATGLLQPAFSHTHPTIEGSPHG